MVTAKFSFEGGSNGANVAAGAGAGTGDTNFDAITRGASATLAYDNTHPGRGSLGLKVATGASSVTSFVSWTTTIGTQTTTFIRALVYVTAGAAANERVYAGVGSAASRGTITLNTAGKLLFQNAAAATVLTSAALPFNSQVRLEAKCIADASVGLWEYKIWYDPRSVGTPDDTQTSAASQAMGGTTDTYRFGLTTAIANGGPYWLDDVAVSTVGYIGPEDPRVTGTAAVFAKKSSLDIVDKSSVSGGPKLKKMTVAISVTETTAVSGGPKLKKMKTAGSVTITTAVSGGPTLKKMKTAGSVTITTAVSGGPKLKKMRVAGSFTETTTISGGPRLKKMKVAVSITEPKPIAVHTKLKKMRVTGSISEMAAISGGPKLKKMRVTGSISEMTAVSGGPKLKKMRVTGSFTETTTISGGPRMKKMHVHVNAVRPVAAPLMVFTAV